MPKIYDNIHNHLTHGLTESLQLSNRTDFCVGYFNLRGWKEVVEHIDALPGDTVYEHNTPVHSYCRLLIGMYKKPPDILRAYFNQDEDDLLDQAEALKLKKQLAQDFKQQLTIGIPTQADELALQKLSQQLKDKKVVVKLHLKHTLHAKLYLTYSNEKRIPIVAFLGSSNLTLAGLAKQGELNIDVLEQDAAQKLAQWFNDRWTDRWSLDISPELIEIIDNSWAADRLLPPYYIYLKMAYHLSTEARAGINEFKLPKIFQKQLLKFQQKAVLVAARHLHQRNGVMIGDVVGLGKTITACALAKIFEHDFFLETLILCPKNLVTMWEGYVYTYKLHARVISQSQVQKQLPNLQRYRLVIIDESHNLRNNQGRRYQAIKSYLEKNDSKVILLSATPYNKSYTDLSNQLRLFIADDQDLGLSPERYIKNLGGQVQFMAQHTETFIRSIKAFERSTYTDDWRELMRLYLVRRTRSFIKENYTNIDEENNRKYLTFPDGTRSYFPDRIPKKITFQFDPNNPKDQYAKLYSKKIVNTINRLQLPRYGLGNYINQHQTKPTKQEQIIIANLSRAGKRLMGFCRTNLFKRLESSGYAFLLSLSRHLLRNSIFIYALNNQKPLPIGPNISQNLDNYLDDDDTDNDHPDNTPLNLSLTQADYLDRGQQIYTLFNTTYHQRFDWINSTLFHPSLKQALEEDNRRILTILKQNKKWHPTQDRKLNTLHTLLTQQHPHEKILLFTQYADTAHYLSQQLQQRGLTQLSPVTGQSENPTALAHRFSPHSNQTTNPNINTTNPLRILIATDVLSEGQNLQDAHIIINYDLPWAIIRLIQRAGRIDRIGQKAEQILCYSFLPEDGLEQIINLRGRLSTRIKENAEVVGSDETFFEGDPINLQDLYNEKAGILDDDEDTEVDLASYAHQIWENATKQNPDLLKIIPNLDNVIYATKQNPTETDKQGIIVYTRTPHHNDILAWINTNSQIITQSQFAILRAAHCEPQTKAYPKLATHHELVEQAVAYIKEDEKNTGGSLGRKNGVKYRVYMRLDTFCKNNPHSLFITDSLKKAIDDIYKYPLKEHARETLNRQLKTGISDETLSTLVTSLREEDKLAIITHTNQPNQHPQIICSMGLKNH